VLLKWNMQRGVPVDAASVAAAASSLLARLDDVVNLEDHLAHL
jgi:hypothetical protein